jgi:hypothetical protein
MLNERSYVSVLPSKRVLTLPFSASKKAATQYVKALAKVDPRNYDGFRTVMVKTAFKGK